MVFKNENAIKGVVDVGKYITHKAIRNVTGHVEIWPLMKAKFDDSEDKDPYAPVDSPPKAPVERLLATKIAASIRNWLDNGYYSLSEQKLSLESKREISPGDILILVRKRSLLFEYIISELKKAKIPTVGVDRMELTSQIIVNDFIALGNFVLNPKDDFNLAVLR